MSFKLSNYLSQPPAVKCLLFGEGKTGKTTFTMSLLNLVAQGYHIIYIDADKSMNVAFGRDVPYADKIDYIQLRDEAYVTIMPFISYLFSKADFWYDAKTGEVVADYRFHKNPKALTKINASHIDSKTIIILDSLTALSESMFNKLREKQGYQATSFDKDKLYNGQVQQYYGVLSTEFAEFLDRLSNINATVFVIAHTKTVEKKDKAGNVIERKIYPLATTINSAESLSKYFDECLYFTARAGKYYVSAVPSSDICGVGGRQVPAKQFTQAELAAVDILKMYNHNVSNSIPSVPAFHDIHLVDDGTEETAQKVALTSNKITL